jgi:hypothetical protein
MHRLAGAKVHQGFWQEGPRTEGLSLGVKPVWDYPPRYRSWQGVNVACFD